MLETRNENAMIIMEKATNFHTKVYGFNEKSIIYHSYKFTLHPMKCFRNVIQNDAYTNILIRYQFSSFKFY